MTLLPHLSSPRPRRVVAALAALAMVSSLATAHAADAVTLQLDWVPGGISAGWFYGLRKNCFADRGITLTITRGFGAGDAVTKVGARGDLFGVTDFGVIVASRAKVGAPVKAIMPIVPQSPFGIAVLEESPIHSLKDLEGRRIASAPSDATMQFLAYGMQKSGADFGKVTKVPAEAAALNGLLLQGRVDALTSYVTSVPLIEDIASKTGRHVRSIPFGQALPLYNASLFTSDAMIATHPDLVKRFRDAAACSFEGARQDPSGAVDALVDQVSGLTRESQAATVPNSFRFAFDNPVFAANGFHWDSIRVAAHVTTVLQATEIPGTFDPAQFFEEPK